MARANRHHIPGQVWHITHRCHKKEFLLKFSKDRRCWHSWLFEARKRFDLKILNYVITSNHIHLLVIDNGPDVIPKSLQLIAGRTAQEFNQRKERKGLYSQPHTLNPVDMVLLRIRKNMKKVCIVGASGKLGQYMVQHALDRGYEVVGVCRERSVGKLDCFKGRITVFPGATNDHQVIKKAVEGCEGVLTVLAPWGIHQYSSGTAQAVLDHAQPASRLIFSCGWHITQDGQDVYSRTFKSVVKAVGWFARLLRVVDLDDQVEACRRVFASNTQWTVVRGSNLEEGASQGLPVWCRHVGDPVLASNITRRVDFALFMVAALENDKLIRAAPAIVGCRTPSALTIKAEG